MKVFCPNDMTPLRVGIDGLAQCPKCWVVYLIAVERVRFACDHMPRPLRGHCRFLGRVVPYEYCSMACKEEMEAGQRLEDLGLD